MPASPTRPLRIVSFNVLPGAYELVRVWAERNGHELILVVTTPGPERLRSLTYREVVARAPFGQDILVAADTARLAAAIAPLDPDLLVSVTFPYRLPPAVLALPRLAAVNLHPAPLPRYRGPNPARMIFDGHRTVGASLHRMDHGFDTGAILSVHEAALPENPTPAPVWDTWRNVIFAALNEGLARAIAGDPGTPQPARGEGRAAPFTAAERVLDWSLPADRVMRRHIGLALFGPGTVVRLAEKLRAVVGLNVVARDERPVPGQVTQLSDTRVLLAVADGFVELELGT